MPKQTSPKGAFVLYALYAIKRISFFISFVYSYICYLDTLNALTTQPFFFSWQILLLQKSGFLCIHVVHGSLRMSRLLATWVSKDHKECPYCVNF